MNIKALSSDPNIKGSLVHYVATAVSLTAITVWAIVASQKKAGDISGWERMAWPITHLKRLLWPWPREKARCRCGRYEDDRYELERPGVFRSEHRN